MLKLIRLEWKKNRIGKYIGKAFIMTAILLLLLFAVAGELESAETNASYGGGMLRAGVDMFANMSYILLASVMLASFIVSAYKNKTMHLMFSYPISRKKILASQMAAVWLFNVTALVLSKILLCAALVAGRRIFAIRADGIELGRGMFYVEILVDSAVMISISFIALLAGLWMKSSKAAIIAGVILVCLTQGNIGAYTLNGNASFYAVLMFLSALSVVLLFCGLETKDV